MIPESSNAKRLTNIGTTSFMPTSGLPLIVAASDSITALVSWFIIYECSDTIEQGMIPGGRLTDVGTHNCTKYLNTSLPARLSYMHSCIL